MTGGVRLALLAVIALLLVTLGFLLAVTWLARRRTEPVSREPPRDAKEGRTDRVADGLRLCPTCGSEYADGLVFCPRDARRLIDLDDVEERAPLAGGVCPRCHRGYESKVRRCPQDGADLVPASLAASFALVGAEDASGVPGKICPKCRSRHAVSASFCGHDGARLVALN